MSAITERLEGLNHAPVNWRAPLEELLPSLEKREDVWKPRPFNIHVLRPPKTTAEKDVLAMIQDRLGLAGCIFVDHPHEKTDVADNAAMHIVFADGTYDSLIDPFSTYGILPKPKGRLFMVNVVDKLPEKVDFDFARGQLVKKSCHNGIVITEGGGKIGWASMQGNYNLLSEKPENNFNNSALRMLYHYGAPMISKRYDVPSQIEWGSWVSSSVHKEMSKGARRLGDEGIIEDRVYFERYAPKLHARALEWIVNKTLGESMRVSSKDGFLAVTKSGGGKVNVSDDPKKGDLIPISHITSDGYVIAGLQGKPLLLRFNNSSVETREAAEIIIARQLLQKGEVKNFQDYNNRLKNNFDSQRFIPVTFKEGLSQNLEIDHAHWHVDTKMTGSSRFDLPVNGHIHKIEVVFPDSSISPPVDGPCGSISARDQTFSALFKSRAMVQKSDLETTVFVNLPGHGYIAVSPRSREELTDMIITLYKEKLLRKPQPF